MKILFVEDEEGIRKPVKKYLERHNYIVEEAEDGKEAISIANVNEYDCILLDLNLPEIDGMEVSRRLKGYGIATPIIMVTARSQMYDKLEGFENGADDYITKPFNLSELLARLKAVIKRSSVNKENILQFAGYDVYVDCNSVMKDGGKEIRLSNKEMGILEYLLRNKGRIVSAEELIEHVWSEELDSFSQTVKTHMKTLRKKVDPQKKYILTFRGKGYLIK